MKGIAALLSTLLLAVGGGFITGCATDADRAADRGDGPHFPFPQRAFGQFAVAPTMPSVKTQAEMEDMIVHLLREILRNDLIVDSGSPPTREEFRMALRHFQAWEVIEGGQLVSHITTSEAHGYGMLMLAYMAGSEERLGFSPDEWIFGSASLKDYFDAMLRTVLEFPSSSSSLFTWRLLGYEDLDQEGVTQGGYRVVNGVKTAPFTRDASFGNSTTDGDMDIIYALILADRQWGSSGRHDYIGIARRMLADLWAYCVHGQYHFLLLGDWVYASGSPIHMNAARTSSLMLSHLRAFMDVDPAHNWQAVIDASHNIISDIRGAQNNLGRVNGLLPDFVVRGAAGWEVPWGNLVAYFGDVFGFDAVRVPWRLGASYMLFGNAAIGDSTLHDLIIGPLDDLARAFPGGFNAFGPMRMDGSSFGAAPNWFAPPFAVTAAARADQQWVDSFWAYTPGSGNPFQGLNAYLGDTHGDYIRLIVLLAITGNYWIP